MSQSELNESTPIFLTIRACFQYSGTSDLTKSLGTGQICSLNGGFVISRFFSIHFTVTLAGISFVISRTSLNRGSLNRGSTVFCDKSPGQKFDCSMAQSRTQSSK